MDSPIHYDNGDSYKGITEIFHHGTIEGEGRILFDKPSSQNHKCSYFGGFSNGKIHGEGVFVFASHNFEGSFVDGKAEGAGELRLGNGALLVRGVWSQGKVKSSPVEISYASGAVYKGSVDANCSPHGQGVISLKVATRRAARKSFEDSSYQDRSAFRSVLENGASGVAVGGASGKPPAVSFTAAQTTVLISGVFDHGTLTGQATVKMPTIALPIYMGSFLNGAYHGNGTYRYLNSHNQLSGSRYEGIFEAGTPCGIGRLFDGDKLRYDGEWRDGVPHGQGWCYTARGARALCYFNKGELLETKLFNKSPAVHHHTIDSSNEDAFDESDSKTEECILDASLEVNDDAEVGTTPLRVTPVITFENSH